MALTDNPMSLTITGNTTIGAELEVSTPTGETILVTRGTRVSILCVNDTQWCNCA